MRFNAASHHHHHHHITYQQAFQNSAKKNRHGAPPGTVSVSEATIDDLAATTESAMDTGATTTASSSTTTTAAAAGEESTSTPIPTAATSLFAEATSKMTPLVAPLQGNPLVRPQPMSVRCVIVIFIVVFVVMVCTLYAKLIQGAFVYRTPHPIYSKVKTNKQTRHLTSINSLLPSTQAPLQVPPICTEFAPKICVIGVGGAGGNAVNNMIMRGLSGVDFLVANTDAQHLATTLTDNRLQIGRDITQGAVHGVWRWHGHTSR